MAEKRVAVGPTGRTVAAQVKRLRELQHLTYAEIGRRLTAAGRPMPILALYRIEALERRVDADDLIALAQALGVSPITLLMPHVTGADEPVELAGFEQPPAEHYWHWLQAEAPVEECDDDTLSWWRFRSRPGYERIQRTVAHFGSDAIPTTEFDQWWEKGNGNGND